MRYNSTTAAVICSTLVGFPQIAFGQNSTVDLPALAQFAKDVCQGAPLESNNGKVELSGEAQAKLSGFLKYLASAGVDVSAKHTGQSSYGVPQDQLAAVMANTNDCRKGVVLGFKDAFVITPRRPIQDDRPMPSPDHGVKKIAYGPFAIGDTIDMIRASGISGRFDIAPDGTEQFEMPTRIPIKERMQFGESIRSMEGSIIYNITQGRVKSILVNVLDRQPCAGLKWPQELLTEATLELGDHTGGPTSSRETTKNDNGGAVIEDTTQFEFRANGELRHVGWVNMTNVSNMSRQACVGFKSYEQEP